MTIIINDCNGLYTKTWHNWDRNIVPQVGDILLFHFGDDNEITQQATVIASVKFNDGNFIDVELFPNNNVDVFAYHADNSDRPCPNIVAYIEDNLPDWDVLAEEWDENNELLETDYLQFYGIL